MNNLKLLIGLLSITLAFIGCDSSSSHALTPDGFQIPDGFKLELIASEPLVSDPVDMAIDEDGKMMVVEMHGYPLDLSGSGVVKQLIDSDNDGVIDKQIVFADGLVLPTGIMKWKTGWMVTDPPHVLFLEDTDQDGRADIRDTLLTGFARSNPQHNVNNPVYGLDNWIYLSHEGSIQTKLFDDILGDEGEEVRYYNHTGPALPRNANGLSVRFKPDALLLENLSSRAQFGHTFDDWGHHFVSSNADHLYHNVLTAKHVERNQDLSISSSRHYTPSTGKGFDIYPITTSPEHQLLTDIGVITSACGTLLYNGGLFMEEYNNSILTAEPVHNLIHLDKIEHDGATFSSANLIEDKEFIASEDSWFRPVNHYIGPDGAIYILDYYRKVIEHPEWLSDEVTQSNDLTAGTDQGRIYRLSPIDSPLFNFDEIKLGQYNVDQLIKTLEHKNIWWRNHAQRLLADQKKVIDPEGLGRFLINTNSPQAKVHAAWILEEMNQMNHHQLEAMLQDPHPGVRENALKIAEQHFDKYSGLLANLLVMVDDPNPKVRFQLLLLLGNYTQREAVQARVHLLSKDLADPWVQIAALTAKELDYNSLYDSAMNALAEDDNMEFYPFISRLSEMIIKTSNQKQINTFINSLISGNIKGGFLPDVYHTIGKALSNKRSFKLSSTNKLLIETSLSTQQEKNLRLAMIEMLGATDYFKEDKNFLVSQAKSLLTSNKIHSVDLKCEAIRIIAKTGNQRFFSLLKQIFIRSKTTDLRLSCLDAFKSMSVDQVSTLILDTWKTLTLGERKKAVLLFLNDNKSRVTLLRAIDQDLIQSSALTWPQKVSLLNSSDPEVRPLARSLLQGSQLNADQLWKQYEPCLSIKGDLEAGADVFEINCGICHQLGGKQGIAFGPDLASIKNRNKASLLLDILQPNRSIADGYELWNLELQTGAQLVGVITEESTNSITIRNAAVVDNTISREEINALTTSEFSAMTDGLQEQISVQEMADLLTFLKGE